MKKKFTWGLIVLTILFVGFLAVQTTQSAPASEQNLIAPNEELPPGFATLEPVAERLESNSTDLWWHQNGPIVFLLMIGLIVFNPMKYIKNRGVK